MDWIEISKNPPRDGYLINTCIIENGEVRNEAKLTKKGSMWWSDGVYVYYWPTHWKPINENAI